MLVDVRWPTDPLLWHSHHILRCLLSFDAQTTMPRPVSQSVASPIITNILRVGCSARSVANLVRFSVPKRATCHFRHLFLVLSLPRHYEYAPLSPFPCLPIALLLCPDPRLPHSASSWPKTSHPQDSVREHILFFSLTPSSSLFHTLSDDFLCLRVLTVHEIVLRHARFQAFAWTSLVLSMDQISSASTREQELVHVWPINQDPPL